MPGITSDGSSAFERRMASALKELGSRITPLEQASRDSVTRHETVIGKLDGLGILVTKQGDKADLVNSRCDDLHTRLTVIETAWHEQMRPGLERLRNLELKVAGAALGGGAVVALVSELIKLVR